MNLLEAARTATEIGARQVWFRLPRAAQDRIQALAPSRSPAAPPMLDLQRLRDRLEDLVSGPSPLLMVHSSADGFRVLDERNQPLPGPRSALAVLNVLLERVGSDGTLCMPTHPLYKDDRGFLEDKSELCLLYRPRRTASSVGLLTELFRRDPGTLRSAHPLCSLAARGPRAGELLRDNLNDREPLPHGIDSGYHRFCRAGGVVLGIGLRLPPPPFRPLFATVLHCAEEAADAEWPVPDFFRPRRFIVEDDEGGKREVRVRERRPEFVRSLALGRLRRDALAEGVLREAQVDGVALDVIDAKGLFEMMTARQRRGPYPYVLPRLAALGATRRRLATVE